MLFKSLAPVFVALAILVISGFGATSASAANNPSPAVTQQADEVLVNCRYDAATFAQLQANGLLNRATAYVPSYIYGDPSNTVYFASYWAGSQMCPSNAQTVFWPVSGPIGPM